MPTGDALEEIPCVGGTTATAAGDATPKPSSLIGGTKAMSKVLAGVSVAAKLANLLQQMQNSPQSQKGYKKATAFPLFLQNLQQKSRKGRSYKWGGGGSSQSFGHPTGRRI